MGSIFGFLFGGRRAANDSEPASRMVELSPFDKLEISGAYSVEVRAGPEYQVRLTANPSVLEALTATVEGGWLTLDTKRQIVTSGPLLAEVTMPDLTQLSISSAVQLTHKDIATAALSLDISGAADIVLAGHVAALEVRASGASKLQASELIAASVYARLDGASSAKLRATTALDVETSGAASCTVFGQPSQLRKRQSGASSIRMD